MRIFRPNADPIDELQHEIAPNGVLRGVRYYWRWTFAIGFLALLAIPFDFFWSRALVSHLLPGEVTRILKFSESFGHGFGVLIICIGVVVLCPRLKRFVPRVATCAILPGLAVNLIKVLVPRQRPGQFGLKFPEHIADTFANAANSPSGQLNVEHITQSFPSAHAATAIGFAVGLGWLFPRGRFLFLALAVVACMQRISFQAHWLSDVLVGAAIGVMMAGALTHNWGLGWFFGKLEKPSLHDLMHSRLDSNEASATDHDANHADSDRGHRRAA